jgi:antitoxin Phd
MMREIQLRDAKASLSAVVAMRGKPAVITRHGKRQAVVVSYEEWERLSAVPSFGRLLMAAPRSVFRQVQVDRRNTLRHCALRLISPISKVS